MYKHKINNMGNKRLPKIDLNSSQNNYASSGVDVKIPWLDQTIGALMKMTFCRTLIMSKILLLLSLKRNSGVRKIKIL